MSEPRAGAVTLPVPGQPAGGYTLTRATERDALAVVALHDDAARWLQTRGIDQWREGEYTSESMQVAICAGHEVYLAWRADRPAGAFSLQWDDAEMWGEQPPDAGYVHGLCVRRACAGVGLGAALLDWAGRRVAAEGRALLRLDCMAANPRLRAWYEAQGFIYQGEAEEGWAALYQRPAQREERLS
ncbi:MAG TPA: GNAT family N-acetyltransferase [Ktedonobacterales bacterium]